MTIEHDGGTWPSEVWLHAPAGTPIRAALAAVWSEMFGGSEAAIETPETSTASVASGATPLAGAIEASSIEVARPPDHHVTCGGIWCLDAIGTPDRWYMFRATCGRCRLTVAAPVVFGIVDPAAYDQWVDPDGLQRQFLAATGLPVSRR